MNFKKEITYLFEKKTTVVAIFLITVLGLIIYANSLTGQFIWDDDFLVKNNLYIRSWHNLGKIFTENMWTGGGIINADYYRPLPMASYLIDYSVWGLNVIGYHLANILLHILVALCVYWLVSILFSNKLLSLLSGIFFVSHPVQTETVASISIRGDLLSTLFILLCFIFYIKLLSKNNASSYIIIALTYILALLSKENALIIPFLVLIYHYVFGKKIRFNKFILLLVITFAYLFLRTAVLSSAPLRTYTIIGIFHRIPGFFIAISNYVRILIFPFDLHAEYGEKLFNLADPKALLGILISFLLIAYALRKRKANSLISFSICWFFLTLLPVSNIYPIGFYMAEHYLYLPSIGFFLALAYGLNNVLSIKRLRIFSIAAIIGLVIFYSSLTAVQTNYWKEPMSFYEKTLKYAPNSSRINNNLGMLYHNKGDYEQAIQLYEKAIKSDPNCIDAYFNLGRLYNARGMQEEAIRLFSKVMGLDSRYWGVYNELGLIYNKTNKNEKAIECFNRAIELNPNRVEAYTNLGMVYNKVGKKEDAIKLYKKAIKLNSYYADSYYNLGNLYFKYGEKEKAIQLYCKAIELNPKDADAYNNLGIIYRDEGNMEEAIRLFRNAIETEPNYALPYYNLSLTYFRMKQYDLAIEYCDKAKTLGFSNPNYLKDLERYRQQKQ